MAITRAQIARQLYKDGKRVALSNGSYDEAGLEVGPAPQTYDSPQQSFTDSVPSSSYDAPTGAVDDPFRGGGQSDDYNYVVTNTTGYDEETGVTTPPRNVGGGDGGADDSLQALYNQGIPESGIPGLIGTGLDMFQGRRNKSLRKNIDFYRYDSITSKARRKYGLTVAGYEQYMKDRLAGKIDAAGNPLGGSDDDDNQPIIPLLQDPMTMDQATEELIEEEEEPCQHQQDQLEIIEKLVVEQQQHKEQHQQQDQQHNKIVIINQLRMIPKKLKVLLGVVDKTLEMNKNYLQLEKLMKQRLLM